MSDQPTQTLEGCGPVWIAWDHDARNPSLGFTVWEQDGHGAITGKEAVARIVELQTALVGCLAWADSNCHEDSNNGWKAARKALGRDSCDT